MMEKRLTQSDIGQWIDNDEGLYNWWRSSRQSKRNFIKENFQDLQLCINEVLNRGPSRRIADKIDGYDRDDLGESQDF